MQRRRFKQAINAYLSRSNAKKKLADVLTERAAQVKLSDEKLKALQAKYKDAIGAFIEEQATTWAAEEKAPALFRAESESLTRSTYIIEKSKPWQSMLKAVLNPDELKRWNAHRNKMLADEALAMRQAEQAAAEAERKRQATVEAQAVSFAQQIVMREMPIARLRSSRTRLLEQCRSLTVVMERNAKLRLTRDVDWIDELFQLTPKQRRKLELAMSGVTKREFRDIVASVTAMEKETPETEADEDAQIEKVLAIFKKFAPPMRLLRAAATERPEPDSQFDHLTESPLWLNALRSTLTEQQVATFEAERVAQKAFARDVRARDAVREFDRTLRLRIEQRTALVELFSADDVKLPVSRGTAKQIYVELSDALTERVDQVLTDTQLEKLMK